MKAKTVNEKFHNSDRFNINRTQLKENHKDVQRMKPLLMTSGKEQTEDESWQISKTLQCHSQPINTIVKNIQAPLKPRQNLPSAQSSDLRQPQALATNQWRHQSSSIMTNCTTVDPQRPLVNIAREPSSCTYSAMVACQVVATRAAEWRA